LDEDWFDAAWALAPREGEGARESLHDILAGTPAIQVRLPAGEVPDAAVGRAALVDVGKETLVVLNMIAVDPAHRRRGLGRALSGTLLALAAVQGARRALLEVEAENTPARTLYRDLGFRRIGGAHSRRGPAPATASCPLARASCRLVPHQCVGTPRMPSCLRSDEMTSHASPTSHGSSSPRRRSPVSRASSTPS